MDSIVIINGEEQSNISVFNRNMQYGDGLFETCIVRDNQILFWEKHFLRLDSGCRKLKIKKLEECGVHIAENLLQIGAKAKEVLG